MRNAFTIDVEDYFHVASFADRIAPSQWHTFENRVVANTRRILDILDEHQIRGTFFVLGWVARHYPGLVREIDRAGHEIGCHGYWHQLIYDLSADEFRRDVCEARGILEDIVGQAVTCYRAPSYSVTRRSLWALDVLVEEGFRYDSSIFPTHHDRYGIPDAPVHPYTIDRGAGSIWEFPPTVVRFCGANVPVSGGGYFRLYPVRLSAYWLRRVNRVAGQPFIFYLHPWEIDPDQPRLSGSLRSRLRHYLNLRQTESKLRRLLPQFTWGAMTDVLQDLEPSRLPTCEVLSN